MSKDPRDGLKLRLGYEAAREIERTPVIGPGVNDAAVCAVNSVLYQRLQEQIIDDNPTAQTLEERIRDINITNIASENNINKRSGSTFWTIWAGSIFWTIWAGTIFGINEVWSTRRTTTQIWPKWWPIRPTTSSPTDGNGKSECTSLCAELTAPGRNSRYQKGNAEAEQATGDSPGGAKSANSCKYKS